MYRYMIHVYMFALFSLKDLMQKSRCSTSSWASCREDTPQARKGGRYADFRSRKTLEERLRMYQK